MQESGVNGHTRSVCDTEIMPPLVKADPKSVNVNLSTGSGMDIEWSTVTDVISVHDRDTLYNWRREDAKVFLADCYYTVHDNVFKSRL